MILKERVMFFAHLFLTFNTHHFSSLHIPMQVELATGQFPYKNCKTDFEVLTKVLQEDPPLLPNNMGFSVDFQSFVKDWWVNCLKNNLQWVVNSFWRRWSELIICRKWAHSSPIRTQEVCMLCHSTTLSNNNPYRDPNDFHPDDVLKVLEV